MLTHTPTHIFQHFPQTYSSGSQLWLFKYRFQGPTPQQSEQSREGEALQARGFLKSGPIRVEKHRARNWLGRKYLLLSLIIRLMVLISSLRSVPYVIVYGFLQCLSLYPRNINAKRNLNMKRQESLKRSQSCVADGKQSSAQEWLMFRVIYFTPPGCI